MGGKRGSSRRVHAVCSFLAAAKQDDFEDRAIVSKSKIVILLAFDLIFDCFLCVLGLGLRSLRFLPPLVTVCFAGPQKEHETIAGTEEKFSIIAQVVSVADMLKKISLLVKVEGGKRELREGRRGADRVIKMRE